MIITIEFMSIKKGLKVLRVNANLRASSEEQCNDLEWSTDKSTN